MNCEVCDELTYVGGYSGGRCRDGCGEMSQRYYKVPYNWLHSPESGLTNELLVFDEFGGTPEGIRLVNIEMVPS